MTKSFDQFLDMFEICEDDCECDDCSNLDENVLSEIKRKIRVTSRGQRIRRMVCPKGRVLRTVNGRKQCVVPTGSQKLKKRIAVRKALRTKKSKGANYKRRISFKRSRALKRRRSMGIRKGQ